MTTSRIGVLVCELVKTLNLLKSLVAELREIEGDTASHGRIRQLLNSLAIRGDLDELPNLLLKAYREVTAALGGIRLSREAIQSQAIDQLRTTHEKLAEVSSHTEVAAMRMLDGLDRTLVLIDQMSDTEKTGSASLVESADVLRIEINALFNCLQFQDITAQQLGGARDLLTDVEKRLEGVANLLDPDADESEAESTGAGRPTGRYDPAASMEGPTSRQELADVTVQDARTMAKQRSGAAEDPAGLPQ